jgi:hypothetical protein
VPRQCECEPDQWRPDHDEQGRAAVDETDRGSGRIGANQLCSGEGHGKRKPGGETEQSGACNSRQERYVPEEEQGADRASNHADGKEPRSALRPALKDATANGSGHEAPEECQRRHHARKTPAVAVVLEKRHSPVPDDDAEPERGGVGNRKRVQPPVADNVCSACTINTPCALAATAISRREGETNEDDAGAYERRHVRSPPVEPLCSHGNDCDSDAAAADSSRAVNSLCACGSNRCADVIASGDKTDASSESRDKSANHADGERRHEEREKVPERDEGKSKHPKSSRSALINKPSAGNLHREVGNEECRRQETNRSKADVVRVRQYIGSRPEVGDVVADGCAERDTGSGPSYTRMRML